MKTNLPTLVGAALVAMLAVGCSTASALPSTHPLRQSVGTGSVIADLRADSNHDGSLDLTGLSDESAEDASPAVFLPNLDDDSRRCHARKQQGGKSSNNAQSLCSDATDEVVNGAADALDLAPLRTVPMPQAAPGSVGRLRLSRGADKARLFIRTDHGWVPLSQTHGLDAEALRAGVQLGLEARDFLRDPAEWDGLVTVEFTVTSGGTTQDSVSLRVAPLLTTNHTMPLQQALAPAVPPGFPEVSRFTAGLRKAVRQARVPGGLKFIRGPYNQYPQDVTEQLYVAIPAAGAPDRVQSMSLMALPAARAHHPGVAALRGPDLGLAFLTLPGRPFVGDAFGNLETLPAYSIDGREYPHGRALLGYEYPEHKLKGDNGRMITFLRTQGAQEPVLIDTSFLAVGHVDEIVQVLPVDNERGWTLAVADPRAGMALLRQAVKAGAGAQQVTEAPDAIPATAAQAIDPRSPGSLVAANERAASKIDANLRILLRETGIQADEVVRIPALYRPVLRMPDRVVAAFPAAINSLLTSRDSVASAHQFSVRVDGVDVFEQAVRAAYGRVGIKVRWVDDTHLWRGYGDVHCGTNAIRRVPGFRN